MLFFLADLAVVLFAWRVAPRVTPDGGGPLLHALVSVLIGAFGVTALTLAAGALGLLSATVLLVGAWGLLALGLAWARGPVERPPVLGTTVNGWTVVPTLLLGLTGGLWAAGPGVRGPSFVFDDLTYHTAVPLFWAQAGGFSYSALTYQSYYPFGAELFGLWSYVLAGDLGPSGIGVLIAALLAVLAGLALLEAIDVPAGPGAAWLAAFLISPEVLHFSRSFSANDLLVGAYVLAALAFSMGPADRRRATWTGLALGAALGTKVSVAPGVLLIGLHWAWRGRKDPVLPVLVAVASLPLGAWWYLHNLVVAGNPLFPAAVGPFDGPLDGATQRQTSLLRFIRADGGTPTFWIDLFANRFDWPVWLGSLSVVGYVVGAVGSVRSRRRAVLLAVLVGLAVLVVFPMQPYSGTINRPFGGLHKMVRYLTFPTMLGLILLASGAAWGRRSERVLTLTGCLAWGVLAWQRWPRLDGLDLGVAGLGALLVVAVFALPPLPFRSRLLPVAGVLLALVTTGRERKAAMAWDHMLGFAKVAERHRPAWQTLDALEPTRVAWISDLPSSHTFAVPLYGSRQQHELVPVDRFGRLLDAPLHERWDPEGSWWDEFLSRPDDDEAVLAELLAGPAETLVISRCHRSARGPWPAPRKALLTRGAAHRLVESPCAEVWDLSGLRR